MQTRPLPETPDARSPAGAEIRLPLVDRCQYGNREYRGSIRRQVAPRAHRARSLTSLTRMTRAERRDPYERTAADGRTWDRTRDLSRVKRALSR